MAFVTVLVLLGLFEPQAQPQQQQQQPIPKVDLSVEVFGTTVADFTAKMDAYAELRRALEEGLPALAVTDKPSDIHRAEQLLAERIRKARRGAGRGAIFTDNVRRAFKQLLRPVSNAATCELIRDDNPGEFPWAVNGPYPKGKPLSTMPPSMLNVLPRLPADVWYRFLGRDLILHDSRANIILDRIDDAFQCP